MFTGVVREDHSCLDSGAERGGVGRGLLPGSTCLLGRAGSRSGPLPEESRRNSNEDRVGSEDGTSQKRSREDACPVIIV